MPDAITYRYSPSKLLGLLALGVGMTSLSAAIALRIIPVEAGSFRHVAGLAGTLFFGLCTGVILWRLLLGSGPVVTLTASGITDRRLAPEEIPWVGIRHLGKLAIQRQLVMILDVDPEVERTLTLTRTVRWSRSANRRLGIDGLATSAQGLTTGFDALFAECHKRCERARRL